MVQLSFLPLALPFPGFDYVSTHNTLYIKMELVTRGEILDVFGDRDFVESSTNAKETTNNGGSDAGEAHGCNESDDESIIVYKYYEIERTGSHGSIDSDMDVPHYMPNQRPVSEPPIFNYEHL